MPPTKEQQQSESTAREKAGIDPALNTQATQVVDDGPRGDPGTDATTSPRPPVTDQRQPPQPPPMIAKRNDIVARFRTERTAVQESERDEIADFAREANLPAEFRQAEHEPPAPTQVEASVEQPGIIEPAADAGDQPKTVRVKVHGQEIELSLEDVIAKAQVALAADNVLDAAKTRLREADDLYRDVANRVARGPSGTPTENSAQPLEPQPSISPDGTVAENQSDQLTKLIESLQFGDPAEARTLLRNTIDEAATTAAKQQLQAQRLTDEGARTAKALNDFRAKHADIAADPLAEAAIQTRMFHLQVSDLKALGVDPADIQTPSGTVTPADITVAHRWYRANGFNVQKPEDLLDQAVKDFVAWKGVKAPADSQPVVPTGKTAPRIEVSVDRDVRRATIPQQPDRAAVPPRPAAEAAAQPRDRSAIVQSMVANRSRPRGKVGIA